MQADNKKRPRAARTAGGRTQEAKTPMPIRKRKAPERGAPLAAARRRSGLSQQQLAERVGVRKQTVLLIEKGATRPRVDLALALSRELGESVESLFGGGR